MKGQNLKRRLAQAGRDQADLARFMGARLGRQVSIKAVSRIVTGERKVLGVEEAAAIEAFFENDPFYQPPVDDGRMMSMPLGPLRAAPPKIPLYGLAAAGNFDGVAYSSDTILDMVDAPIRNVDAAFRVAGSSMEPRLFAGETVFVKLGVNPGRGEDAVVEMKDDKQGVLIKTYQQTKDGFVFLHQWNPQSEVRLKAQDVRAIHAVRLRA